MNIFIDLETIPDQSEDAIHRYISGEVRCPFKTKADTGKDLGMSADEIKFIGAEDLKQIWVEKKGENAAMAQAEEKWLKTSLNADRGEICCIGFAFNNYEIKTISRSEFKTERLMLEEFWSVVATETLNKPKLFIAHNANFDLPFLFKRSVINGVSPGFKFDAYARQGKARYCTMEAWAGFKGMISLDELANILGVKGKLKGMTGADVWPEYEKGNTGRIAEYCADDVRALREVYNRINFM